MESSISWCQWASAEKTPRQRGGFETSHPSRVRRCGLSGRDIVSKWGTENLSRDEKIALRPPRNGTRPGPSATTVQFFHTRLSSLYRNEQTEDRQLVYPSHPFSTVLIITDIFLSFFVCIHSFRISFSPVQVLRRDKLVFKLFYISVICFPLAAAILTIYIMTCSTTQRYSTIGRNTIFSDQVGKLLQDQIIVR
jgi:hypothetical protein